MILRCKTVANGDIGDGSVWHLMIKAPLATKNVWTNPDVLFKRCQTEPSPMSPRLNVLVESLADGAGAGVEFLDHSLDALTQASFVEIYGKYVLAAIELF